MDAKAEQLNYYRLSTDVVLEQLESKPGGLSSKEAAARLERSGGNELQRTKHETAIVTLLRQFKNLLVIMLLTSAAFSLYLKDDKTATILIAIAAMNAGVGFFQEHKAERIVNSLEKLLVPRAKVLRGGVLQEIDSTKLVPGDVIYVEGGDSVPADVRILDEDELSTNDFALTGESNPSRKFVHAISDEVTVGSRHNLLFMGTTVATGSGHGVVIGTGMTSELGRIAGLSQATHTEPSPLQKEMNHLATRIAQATVVLAGLLTAIALKSNLSIHDAILFGIGIGAAMIPNGLVAEVNITLAQAASRLAKDRALVKKLSAVETLGATNFILTDKTGTLTKNEMTVTQMLIGHTNYSATGTGYEANGKIVNEHGKTLPENTIKDLDLFFMTAALASNAKVDPPDDEHADWYVIGDPTEGALITLVRKAGFDPDTLDQNMPEIKEYQFDSARKLLSSVRHRGDQIVVFTKGAPESVLSRANEVWDHGHVRKLTQTDRKFFTEWEEKQAHDAMRNLAFGYRILPAKTDLKNLKMEEVEQEFTLLGMVSMMDPLRDAVPAAMKAAHNAHVKVSIVTGDFSITARAIARQAGLADDITIVQGEELPKLSDGEILQLVSRGGAVFSRVAPEDKLRIVEIAKRSGHVVAVTGDGINDAPALKRADIGVAMGRTGTDVAKDAAEIILLDDSFNTLVGAIEQGRLTFRNIKKAARCALTDNCGELIAILASLVGQIAFKIPLAILPIQILAIDIIAQMFPITALGWDQAQRGLMHDQPRKLSDHIVNAHSAFEFLGFGFLSAGLAYANYLYFFTRHHLSVTAVGLVGTPTYAKATILTYLTIVLCQFMNLLLVRTDEREGFFARYLWSNKKLLGAFAISFFCIANMMYNPMIQPYFHAGPLTFTDWLSAIACALIYLSLRLFERYTRRHSRKSVLKLHRELAGA